MLTIKANAYYRTRSGEKAYVATFVPANPLTGNQVESPVGGYIDSMFCSWGRDGRYLDNLYDHGLDLVAEWVDEVPAAPTGLTLLEAMRSGRHFRVVGGKWASGTECDWLMYSSDYVNYVDASDHILPLNEEALTARYELRPEEPAAPLECWVVYDQKGNFVSQYYEYYIAASSVMAAFPGYTIKHMREVVDVAK